MATEAPDPGVTATDPLAARFDRSLTLCCIAYNEEKLAAAFFEKALALLGASVEDFEIVFVDDGSNDRTPEIAGQFAARDPRIRIVTHDRNRGIGPAAKLAMANATKEYVMFQTADWSYELRELRIFLELTRRFDIVVGVRPLPTRPLAHIPLVRSIYRIKGRSDDLPRAIVSLGNYYVLRTLFGMRFADFQNINIYPRTFLQSLDLKGNSSFLTPEILGNAYRAGMTFIEVPIRFLPRTAGVAKGIRPKAIYRSVRDILAAWFDWGIPLRARLWREERRQIFTLFEPAYVDAESIRIAAPLFKYFLPPSKASKQAGADR